MTDRPDAGRIVDFGGKPYLLGIVWTDAGDWISDPVPIELTATGLRSHV